MQGNRSSCSVSLPSERPSKLQRVGQHMLQVGSNLALTIFVAAKIKEHPPKASAHLHLSGPPGPKPRKKPETVSPQESGKSLEKSGESGKSLEKVPKDFSRLFPPPGRTRRETFSDFLEFSGADSPQSKKCFSLLNPQILGFCVLLLALELQMNSFDFLGKDCQSRVYSVFELLYFFKGFRFCGSRMTSHHMYTLCEPRSYMLVISSAIRGGPDN